MKKKDLIKPKFNFGYWVLELFEDEKNEPSIKPIISLITCIFLCVSMVLNAVIPTYSPDETLVDAVMIICSIGLGSDSIDKFSRKKSYHRPSSSYQEYDSNNEYDPNQKGDEVL